MHYIKPALYVDVVTIIIFEIHRENLQSNSRAASGCMSAVDKKSAYIFCKDNCIGLPHGHEF